MHGSRNRYVLFARTHWYAVHIVFSSTNLLIASPLEACRQIVVLTAPQAFTLAPSIKAEKLNSAIEKRHWKACNGFEPAFFKRRGSGACGDSLARSIGETGRAGTG
jgi:hypothetical protein